MLAENRIKLEGKISLLWSLMELVSVLSSSNITFCWLWPLMARQKWKELSPETGWRSANPLDSAEQMDVVNSITKVHQQNSSILTCSDNTSVVAFCG
jgi:hypothetical protein